MANPEIELIVNSISVITLFVSFIVLFILGYRIYKRQERGVIENTFAFSLIIASIGSLQASIFRSFYVLFDSGILVQTWTIASYLYFSLMSIGLTGFFTVSLGIYKGQDVFNRGWLMLIGLVPIGAGYWFVPSAVTVIENLADTEMSFIGLVLVFGTLGCQIMLNIVIYFLIYRLTHNKGSLYMTVGMFSIAISAIIGGLSDILGDIGRLFDFVGYLGILIGLIIIYRGFKEQQ